MLPIETLLHRLTKAYPDPKYELKWTTPFELLIATILAAQCKDEVVNRVTAYLFQKYKAPQDFIIATSAELNRELRSITWHEKKVQMIQETCVDLLMKHEGEVPADMQALIELPGVGRKTANVVLNTAFNQASGIIVDTHVLRVSQRLGLTRKQTPSHIEKDLMELFPQQTWTFVGPALVLHGRYVCTYSKPKCAECPLSDICPKVGV